MKASLQKGQVKNEIVTCPWHHWQYDLKTGQCLTVDKFKLKTYQVEVEGDEVYIILE
jgi:nitrite reductase/ring-hydroxylating ferredoxin subunit